MVRSKRTLTTASAAHALHDGCADLIYVLLPLWQAEFGLSYGALALLRGLYSGAMAALQVPSGRLAERWGGRFILVCGTIVTGLGFVVAGSSGGVLGLCAGLTLAGIGSSTQHPIASAAVSRAYGGSARGPLGVYNFSGDIGKAAIPALASGLLMVMSWQLSLGLIAVLAVVVAAGIAIAMPPLAPPPAAAEKTPTIGKGRGGFGLLLTIGVLDSGVRMGLLTFLPFLLREKGASLPTVGLGLALVFMGGAAGKFVCGWLGGRFGTLRTVLATEGGTAALILAVLASPLFPSLCLLPILGLVLNGTSSVLYGSVPELRLPHQSEERAFALFYTGTIGSGAISPVLYGILGDAVGAGWAVTATAMVALAIFPFVFALAPHLER
ncbi:MFS transporter [Magnetospirillum molischianum]|uniref:Major facilitator superfamily MFS_1 n=1 Tax=Magnetospirillum molischianum DSM 120 TaxID=1150626 RepID=H8FUG2_MAGML|nr:MFS transporter [Magnetospirillum molischianum]CCG42000.1 Major facilitator superfamily MFS_1 [Magnetospirillum molischianum DSM 120]